MPRLRQALATAVKVAAASAAVVLAVGCTSVGSSAVRTDGMPARPQIGAVRLYGITQPAGSRVIGIVEVHAIQEEANIEVLLPTFARRVAELGGTGGVIDRVLTGYEWRTEMRMQSYSYPCGYRHTCWGTRMMPYSYEVRYLTIQGRAVIPENAPAPAPAPVPAPALAPETPVTPIVPMGKGGAK